MLKGALVLPFNITAFRVLATAIDSGFLAVWNGRRKALDATPPPSVQKGS